MVFYSKSSDPILNRKSSDSSKDQISVGTNTSSNLTYLLEFLIYDELVKRIQAGVEIDILFDGILIQVYNDTRLKDTRRIEDRELKESIRLKVVEIEERSRCVLTSSDMCPIVLKSMSESSEQSNNERSNDERSNDERSNDGRSENQPSHTDDSDSGSESSVVSRVRTHFQMWIEDERNEVLELMLRNTKFRHSQTIQNGSELVDSLVANTSIQKIKTIPTKQTIETKIETKDERTSTPPRSSILFSIKLNQLIQRVSSDEELTFNVERMRILFDELSEEDQTEYLKRTEELDGSGSKPFLMRVIRSDLSTHSKRIIIERLAQLCQQPTSHQNANDPNGIGSWFVSSEKFGDSLSASNPNMSTTKTRQPQNTNDQKIREWLRVVSSIPFDSYAGLPDIAVDDRSTVDGQTTIRNYQRYLRQCRTRLEKKIYGHHDAKSQLMRIISTELCIGNDRRESHNKANISSPNISSPNTNQASHVIGIEGPPGVGKTTLVREVVGQMLGRPLIVINLGGAHDSSFLEGHEYTFHGSQPGEIARALINSGVMNPVIYFDELDKVSKSERGGEIINCLMHLVDPAQHKTFRDKYLGGVELDLRGVVFVFSMNDCSAVNPILLDRMRMIRVGGYEMWEKVELTNLSLLSEIEQEIGVRSGFFKFEPGSVEYVINRYTEEGGIRRLREILAEIMMELRLRGMERRTVDDGTKAIHIPQTVFDTNTKQVGAKQVGTKSKKTKSKFVITTGMLEHDLLRDRHPIVRETCKDGSLVGTVNGAWASRNGVGGILPIQAIIVDGKVSQNSRITSKDVIAKTKLELDLDGMSVTQMELRCTGMQGDVMKESMEVSKNVAIMLCMTRFGYDVKDIPKCIHIHCPNGGVRKDGPSAGIAITIAVMSRLLNFPVNNRLSMTGEIDLNGNVLAIGGIQEKVFGAKRAGVLRFLYPSANQRDVSELKRKHGSNLNGIELISVSHIEDVVGYALC